MWKADIKPGTEYALREKRRRGEPFQRVKILAHVRTNKWKAQWIDPNPGLVDYVLSTQLVVRWRDAKAFLKEEANEDRIHQHNAEQGYRRNSPVERALEEVFGSAGDDACFFQGCLSGSPDALARVAARVGLTEVPRTLVDYKDRRGELILPFETALDLARRFCAAEPSTVLTAVESTEREWAQQADRGENYIVSLLNEYRAAWALIRQWAGVDAAVAKREVEIQRLERLVWDAIYALQQAGADGEAARLRRAVQRASQ